MAADPDDIEIDRRLMSPDMLDGFWAFVQEAWPHMGDASEIVPTRYMQVMCATLQRLQRREIPDLLVNIPPSHSKSVIISVLYTAWVWTFDRTHRFICLSYDMGAVLRDADKCRRLVQSAWYQDRWPVRFRKSTAAKGWYETDEGGYRISTTIRSGITSKHADTIILDDPQNPQKLRPEEADEAAAEAAEAKYCWDSVLPSRVVDLRTSRRVLVMQRLGETDLTQHILDQRHPLEHLMLPLHFARERACSADWRTEEGELLAPERYDEESIQAQVLSKLTPAAVSAQYEQDPTAKGAGMFYLEEFRFVPSWDDLPRAGLICISIDGRTSGRARGRGAQEEETRSAWGIQAWLRCKDKYYLLDALAPREDFDKVLYEIQDLVKRLRAYIVGQPKLRKPPTWVLHKILIERASTGEAAASMLKHLDVGTFRHELISVGVSKVERASTALPVVREGRVYLPSEVKTATSGPMKVLRDEITKFPRGKTNDQIDAMSQLILWWEKDIHGVKALPTQVQVRKLARTLLR